MALSITERVHSKSVTLSPPGARRYTVTGWPRCVAVTVSRSRRRAVGCESKSAEIWGAAEHLCRTERRGGDTRPLPGTAGPPEVSTTGRGAAGDPLMETTGGPPLRARVCQSVWRRVCDVTGLGTCGSRLLQSAGSADAPGDAAQRPLRSSRPVSAPNARRRR